MSFLTSTKSSHQPTARTLACPHMTLHNVILLAFVTLTITLLSSSTEARTLSNDHHNSQQPEHHEEAKRFYIPVMMSSDVVLASLRNRKPQQGLVDAHQQQQPLVLPVSGGGGAAAAFTSAEDEARRLGNLITESGLQRKRTANRDEYLDSMGSFSRTLLPKRKMFFGPLGYMGASARIMNQNRDNRINSNGDSSRGSPGFRYG